MTHLHSIKPTPFGAWDQDELAAAWQEHRRQETGVGRREEPTEMGRKLLRLFDRNAELTTTDIAHKSGKKPIHVETSMRGLRKAGWADYSLIRGEEVGEPDIKIWRAIK